MLMFLLPEFLAAQDEFFTKHDPSEVIMKPEDKLRYEKLLTENHGEVKIVSTVNFQALNSDEFVIQLPGIETPLKVTGELVASDGEIGLMWSGRITNQLGYVCLVAKDELIGGFIQVDKDFYELSPMNNKYQFLIKTSKKNAPSCGSPSVLDPEPHPLTTEPGPPKCEFPLNFNTYNTCSALISVLLVITPEARTWIEHSFGTAFGVPLFAALGQMSVNYAFYNSDVPNKEIRVKYVFKDLQSELSGFDIPEVQNLLPKPNILGDLRTVHNADVAFMVVNDVYLQSGIAGFVSGIGPNSSAKAFGAVEAQYFINQYTLAHELGHIMGCRHNWPSTVGDDNTPICAHGKRLMPTTVEYTEPPTTYAIDSWRTIMGVPPPIGLDANYEFTNISGTYYVRIQNDYRILHYSNPTVFFGSESTGTASDYIADNATYIRNFACDISKYKQTQELSVNIGTSYCESIPYNLYADISTPSAGMPGQGPYTVRWFWNETGYFGVNPSLQLLGEGQTLSLSEHPACPVYWVKCFVFAADGTWVSKIKKIELNNCFCIQRPEGNGNRAESSSSAQKQINELSVQPNPSEGGIVLVSIKTLKNREASISILSMDGHYRQTLTQYFDEEGLTSLNLNLPSGVYVLTTSTPTGNTSTTKLIILNN